jgi:hypothetical protein
MSRNGVEQSLGEAMAEFTAPGLAYVDVRGHAAREKDLSVPYRGKRLFGTELRTQIDTWVRDGIAEIVDGFINPIGWVAYSSLDDGTKLAIAIGALSIRTVQTRAGLLQAIETAKESSVDYYLSVQGAYYQYRHGMLMDGKDDDDDDQFEKPALPQGTFKGLEANGWSNVE